MNFLQRIKADLNEPRNRRGMQENTVVNARALRELLGHFETMDAIERSMHTESRKLETRTETGGLGDSIVMRWIPCANWDDLPEGTWLVKIGKDRKPYNIAEVTQNPQGRIIIVGNCFHWDMGDIVAYTALAKYEP